MIDLILLPGILMPAALRYEKLIAALGPDVRALSKDLEVYGGPQTPPPGYSLEAECEGIDRFAAAHGLERFHLYGHSGGGACALAYTARAPERVLSLALDEAASDFSPEMEARIRDVFIPMLRRSDEELIGAFAGTMIRSDLEPPAPPPGPPPPWMANRPAGVRAFIEALAEAKVDREALRSYRRPVSYSYGGLTHESWHEMGARLKDLFPDYTVERYDERHHAITSHIAEPERVAAALRALWARAQA